MSTYAGQNIYYSALKKSGVRYKGLDHVIVGRRIGKRPGYFSFQEAGLL
jgi:hypothetical protein